MPNIEVNCTVSNCIFHKKENVCGAERILIDKEYNSKNAREEFASEHNFREIKKEAKKSEETCCKTFKPKHEC